jgi:mannose-6-phosphate isomerase-like protein (cupin superfamily)
MVNCSVSVRAPLALKIFAVPEPLKELGVELNATRDVPTMNPESFSVESKMKFFILNVYGGVPEVLRGVPSAVRSANISCSNRKLNWSLEVSLKNLLALHMLLTAALLAQERSVDPTWLHRSLSSLGEARTDLSTPTCHFKPIFGQGDSQSGILRTVFRFGQVTIDSDGGCNPNVYPRREEIYFVLKGKGSLHYGDETQPLRKNDFTYLPPGVKHSISNRSEETLTIIVMSFDIPDSVTIGAPKPHPKVANLDDLKEEPVQGHPTSVLYKLMVGPRTGRRDAIDAAYVVTSLFWMNFAPGGTNFPHHHESAEEIYLVIEGQGEMVAGGGMDGVEGRHPAKAGEAYYFRPNCTVGFYNQTKPGAQAYILAVRSRVLLREETD